jgi:hypothetical protein
MFSVVNKAVPFLEEKSSKGSIENKDADQRSVFPAVGDNWKPQITSGIRKGPKERQKPSKKFSTNTL